jgi:hypothetical protein
MFKKYLQEMLSTTSLDEVNKNKLCKIVDNKVTSLMIYLRELFR